MLNTCALFHSLIPRTTPDKTDRYKYTYYWLYAFEFVNRDIRSGTGYVDIEKHSISASDMVPCSTASLTLVRKVIIIENCKSGSSYPDILIIIDPV